MALPLHLHDTPQASPPKVSKTGMSPYSLLLSHSYYEILRENAAPGSDAHNALMKAVPPTKNGHRVLACTAKAIEELLNLAVRVCPNAVVEISRQIRNQLA